MHLDCGYFDSVIYCTDFDRQWFSAIVHVYRRLQINVHYRSCVNEIWSWIQSCMQSIFSMLSIEQAWIKSRSRQYHSQEMRRKIDEIITMMYFGYKEAYPFWNIYSRGRNHIFFISTPGSERLQFHSHSMPLLGDKMLSKNVQMSSRIMLWVWNPLEVELVSTHGEAYKFWYWSIWQKLLTSEIEMHMQGRQRSKSALRLRMNPAWKCCILDQNLFADT